MWLLVCGKQCHTSENKFSIISLSVISELSFFTSTMRKGISKQDISRNKTRRGSFSVVQILKH